MPKNFIKLLLVVTLTGVGILGILNRDTVAGTFGPLFIFNKFTATAASSATYQDVQGDVQISGNTTIIGNYKFSSVGIKVDAGTIFPASPTTGDRFLRTDRNIWYYWDGTRWLSEQVFNVPITRYSSWGNENQALMPFPWDGGAGNNKIYVLNWITSYYVSAPNNSTNYWTVYLRLGNNPIKDSFSTVGTSAQIWSRSVRNINTEWIDTHGYIFTYAQATGTPGGLYAYSAITYRLVGS